MEHSVDVVIVGGGAAGLTAALFAARRGFSVVVLTQDIGGQASTTAMVENYPGFERVDGFELMEKFQRQAERDGAKVIIDEVIAIENKHNHFQVKGRQHQYVGTVVILAYGLTHRHLNVPGEEALIGRGVSYCASCDVAKYHSQAVAVVGGGNSAMDAALVLAARANHVTLLTHNPEFRGERVLIDRIMNNPHVTPITNATTKEVLGAEQVTGLAYEHQGTMQHVAVHGVFVEIGFTVKPDLVKGLVTLDARNQVIVDPQTNGTNVPGLFAAGDVTSVNQKQIVISAGEGAKAALGAYQYLQSIDRAPRGGLVDWGVATPMRHEHPLT